MKARLTLAVWVSLLLGACAHQRTWQAELDETLPLLGHRNWIAVVDSAYPLQTAPGLRIVLAPADMLEVVEAVLAALDASDHVRPVVYLDSELEAVSEADAPGIGAYRAGLARVLGERNVERLPHQEIIESLDAAGAQFTVLVLKTPIELPYTSVFLQLDCGYWSEAAEERLRAALGGQ